MATIVNERDVLIRSAPSRLIDHDLGSNVNVPVFKGISLAAPGAIFRLAVNGDVSPTTITATVTPRGFTSDPAVTWSVVYGTLTTAPAGTGLTYEMVAANMATDVVTLQASVTVGGMTYTDSLMFVKIQDGSVGQPGSRGTINAVRAITGTAWSSAEATQALADYGLQAPFDLVAGDVVTLHNLNEGFSEIRRYSGSVWVLEAPAFPGKNILKGSVATEQLLVTGMAESLNADPNTVDVTAWTGNGLSIVADATAPNGATALRCAGQGTTVLSRKFPVNDSDNYQVKTWAKADSGSPTAYLVVAFYDASGAVLPGTANPSGWTSVGDFHYYGLANEVMPTAWTNYEASFGNDETFKVPAGATHAAVGLISNFLNGTVQRISGMVCRRKIDGRVVVDGSLSARHVVTNGMNVVNELGQVLLEAGGASTPPWVVYVENLQESGITAWALPPDSSNRAALRGLLVDGENLKASYSPSGASVVLDSTAMDVWNTLYTGDLAFLPADGMTAVWNGRYDMRPNTTYVLDVYARPAQDNLSAPGNSSMDIGLSVPAGSSGQILSGAAFTATTETLVTIATVVAPPYGAIPAMPVAPSASVFVTSGAAGGPLILKAHALSALLRLCAGTRFVLRRFNGATVPEPNVARAANVTSAFTVLGASAPTSADMSRTLVTAQPYEMALVRARYCPTKPTYYWANCNIRFLNDAANGKAWAYISIKDYDPDGVTYGFSCMYEILNGLSAAEVPRWDFTVTMASPFGDLYGGGRRGAQGALTLPLQSDHMVGTPTQEVAQPVPEGYVWFPFADSASTTVDVTIQPRFMGEPVGTPWTFRTTLDPY